MKAPRTRMASIPLYEDLASPPGHSRLRELAEMEKDGKIKIWPGGIMQSPLSPGWVVVIYDEMEAE